MFLRSCCVVVGGVGLCVGSGLGVGGGFNSVLRLLLLMLQLLFDFFVLYIGVE